VAPPAGRPADHLATHIMREVELVADRLLVMRHGRSLDGRPAALGSGADLETAVHRLLAELRRKRSRRRAGGALPRRNRRRELRQSLTSSARTVASCCATGVRCSSTSCCRRCSIR